MCARACSLLPNLFDKLQLVQSGRVCLERFQSLPMLDKPAIRAMFMRLLLTRPAV